MPCMKRTVIVFEDGVNYDHKIIQQIIKNGREQNITCIMCMQLNDLPKHLLNEINYYYILEKSSREIHSELREHLSAFTLSRHVEYDIMTVVKER